MARRMPTLAARATQVSAPLRQAPALPVLNRALASYQTMPTDKNYFRNPQPFRVPTTDGKLIEEHIGQASTGTAQYSVAHMVAPPQWSEPHQRPEFDEVTIVVRGRKRFEIDGETVELHAGESLLIKAGARVRYSNPFDVECEYWSICVPAFSPATVHREEETAAH
jgi:mannose-6-phosphate isomerase-like protein (cupin superfamily)